MTLADYVLSVFPGTLGALARTVMDRVRSWDHDGLSVLEARALLASVDDDGRVRNPGVRITLIVEPITPEEAQDLVEEQLRSGNTGGDTVEEAVRRAPWRKEQQ